MTILHLGVVDQPYVNKPKKIPKKTPKRPRKAQAGEKTTGDIATILEAKYHIMELFYREEREKIKALMHDAIEGAVEDLLSGAPARPNMSPFEAAAPQIEALFRDFLDKKRLDNLWPGIPTMAALKGVNHRLKIKRGMPRPSFIDTGLYEASFKAWFDPS